SGPSLKPLPSSRTAANSPRESSRAVLGKPSARSRVGIAPYFFGALTTSRLRPFARRRFRTLRPALVALRLRKPCSRLRRTLLGWYVRFTTATSSSRNAGERKSAAIKHAAMALSTARREPRPKEFEADRARPGAGAAPGRQRKGLVQIV